MGLGIGICAGGKSNRMGSDKALLKWKGMSLAEILYTRFSGVYDVIFSLGSPSDSTSEYILEHTPKAKIVFDEYKYYGPIEGIRRILEMSENDHVFICGVDMPFISVELVKYMEQFISTDYDCICLMADEKPQPLCAVYSVNASVVIRKLIARGEHRLNVLMGSLRTKYIGLAYTNFDYRICMNLNDPRQFVESRLPVVFCVCGYQNSGKTTLICELVKRFAEDGLRAAVIKHTSHIHDFEKAGTDTKRFAEAGAVYRGIFSDFDYFLSVSKHIDLEDAVKMCKDASVIIVEGMKNNDSIPKILNITPDTRQFPPEVKNVIYTINNYSQEISDITSLYRTIIEYFDLDRLIR